MIIRGSNYLFNEEEFINKFRGKKDKDQTRINYMITSPEVRVVGKEGDPLGILSIEVALDKAKDADCDLVEVAPSAVPPVCRIMDYGKFKYEKAKKQKLARKKQHIMHLKEIKLHPKTDTHDYNFKIEHAKNFLLKGDRVKVTVVFRGREIVYKNFGLKLLDRVHEDLMPMSSCEQQYKMEGRNMISNYVPDKVKVNAYLKAQKAAEENKELIEKAEEAKIVEKVVEHNTEQESTASGTEN